jgi:hypothetical protein
MMAFDPLHALLRNRLVIVAALVFWIEVPGSLARQAGELSPRVADRPLTAEQLNIYRAAIASWYQGDKAKVNLAALTDPADGTGDSLDKGCLKGLSMEAVRAGHVHRIRQEDLAQLGPGEFHLVDPKAGAREVSDNDPGNAIQRGKQVDEAVDNGFAHGLLTLGEVQFNSTHTRALVSFSFVCGGLCGHGTSMLMGKKDGVWKRRAQCGGWIS